MFAHSLTLLGFEQKSYAHWAVPPNRKRLEPQRAMGCASSTWDSCRRTSRALGPTFSSPNRAGEIYRNVRDRPAEGLLLTEVVKAKTVAFILDGERLADNLRRAEAFASARNMLRALADAGAISTSAEVQLVTTKFDLIAGDDQEAVRQILSEFEERLAALYRPKFARFSTWRTAARDPEGVHEPAWGVAPLLGSWLNPPALPVPEPAPIPPLTDECDRLLLRRRAGMMDRDFVIIGLPASGKTTFLAALWHIIEAEETACRLRLARWEGELGYLNSIAQAWRSFAPVPRTSQIGDKYVTIHLVNRETGVQGAAFFPDLAGDTFDIQVETRRCRPDFLENVAKEGGVLLFISADSRQDGLSIVELNAQFPDGDGNIIIGEAKEIEPSQGTPPGVAEPQQQGAPVAEAVPILSQQSEEWQPKTVLAQVRIVQLLSDLISASIHPASPAVGGDHLGLGPHARGIYAGQVVEHADAASRPVPEGQRRSLWTNLYGVSAQGVKLGDFEAVKEAAKLISSDRIRIVGPEGEGKDLTIPLVWLMSA